MFSIKRTTTAVLASIAIAAAAGVPGASARPAGPDTGSSGIAVRGLDDMHNAAVLEAAGTLDTPDNAAVKVPAADTGIDWAGIGIGGGLAAALLAGAGVVLVRRPTRMRLH